MPGRRLREGVETPAHDDDASHHLGEGIAVLRAAKIRPILLASMPMGDTAMVGSEADIATMKQGKSTTTRSRELLNLKRNGTIWKIVSIRWQSEPIEKPHGG